jgi:enoyl-CoA hydratase/carnithine racemase
MVTERMIDTGTGQLTCVVRDGVGIITLNRPEARNAFSMEMSAALRRMIPVCAQDPDVRALLFTGAGTAFCAGGDVKNMGDRRSPTDLTHDQRFRVMQERHHGSAGAIRALRKPTVAALPGAAAGAGLALALSCDIRIAATSAFAATGYSRVALSGDYGIAWLLTRAIGSSRARELMLTNERVSAERGAQLGLFNRVVDDAALQTEAFALAKALAEGPAIAIGYMKDNLDEALSVTHAEAIDREAERLMRTQGTEDHKEAVRAFVDKRKPIFKGR